MSDRMISDEIAEAVLSELNSGAFHLPVAAIQEELPEFTLEELTTLRTAVTDNGLVITAGTRGEDWHDYTIDIGIQRRAADDEDTARTVKKLGQDILDHFRKHRLASYQDASWRSGEMMNAKGDPEYARWLRENRVVFIVVRLTYRVLR